MWPKYHLSIRKKLIQIKNKITFRKIILKIISSIQFALYFSELKIYFFNFLKEKKFINPKKLKNPIFLYDLRDDSLTFDFGDTLLFANFWLNKLGYENCDCVIIAIREDFEPMQFRSYDKLFTKDELWKRIDNILIPLAQAANFINNIILVSEKSKLKKILKDNFIVYPPHYIYFEKFNFLSKGEPLNRFKNFIQNKKEFYSIINFLEPNSKSINEVKKSLNILAKDKIVTFTIRDYKFDEIRNTNYDFVKSLHKFFKDKGYRFIVIPDHKNQSPNLDMEIFFDATINTHKRIAIYNIAKINIGTVGGPLWLARYMPGVNMFLTNVALDGDHIGSYQDLRKYYGSNFNKNTQPFQEFDMHLIFGPEDNIEKLISNKSFKQIMRINDSF